MPTIRWPKEGLEVVVEIGTDLRTAAKKVDAPQGDACGGKCACSTCHIYVQKGAELLSEPDEDEEDTIEKGFDVRRNSRLGCQTRVLRDGVVELEVSRESRESFWNEHPEHAPADWRKAK